MINSLKLPEQEACMRKHIFLLVSVGILSFMALTTEKKILVTTGYAVTEEELAFGHAVYQDSCSHCHENGDNGAPSTGDRQVWDARLAEGIEKLIQRRAQQCPFRQHDSTHLPLSIKEIEAAIAFMISQSRR
jgi:cytochrome c5